MRDWRCLAINLSKAWDNLKPRYGSTRSVFQVTSLLMLRSTLESKCSISSPGHEEMIDQHSDSFKSHEIVLNLRKGVSTVSGDGLSMPLPFAWSCSVKKAQNFKTVLSTNSRHKVSLALEILA